MDVFIDLLGKTFGALVVRRRAGSKNRKTVWECQCSCGAVLNVRGDQLRKGRATSCVSCNPKTVPQKIFM